jgi:hypothetical protein
VAIHAADLASLDFHLQLCQAPTAPAQERYLFELLFTIDMIELEHIQVALTTIDARMRLQVVENVGSISHPIALSCDRSPGVMLRSVRGVVLPAIERHAGFAIRTPAPIGAPRERRRREIFVALWAVPKFEFHR